MRPGAATDTHSNAAALSHRDPTGATLPREHRRESSNSPPATDSTAPPASGDTAGATPATCASRAKLTPAPSEEPPTRRVAGPSSDQAASHTASAVDTRCAGGVRGGLVGGGPRDSARGGLLGGRGRELRAGGARGWGGPGGVARGRRRRAVGGGGRV